MSSHITPVHPSEPLITVRQANGGGKSMPLVPLILGEQLEVVVLQQTTDQKALLQIKNGTLTAETPFPLPIGEKLTVRVDQLQPSIVLKRMVQNDPAIFKASDFLKFYRSNPEALKEIFITVKEIINGPELRLSNVLSKNDVQNVRHILDQLIGSKESLANPLFLKNYITALGMTDERKLLKALLDPTFDKEAHDSTLKEVLLKLSSERSPLLPLPQDSDPDIPQIIRQLSDFAGHAAKVIESLQIANILAHDQEGLYTLQVPLQFTDGIRMQDIFIETDRECSTDPGKAQYRVVLFLDMDALGELMMDVGIKEGLLRCTIKCQDAKVLNYIQTALPELTEVLAKTGYKCAGIQCQLDSQSLSWKRDYLFDHPFFQQNSINVCA